MRTKTAPIQPAIALAGPNSRIVVVSPDQVRRERAQAAQPLGEEESNVAKSLIAAAADESAKAVMGDIEAHKAIWRGRPEPERDTLIARAALWASRQTGHRRAR
jgi:hypothetical protein